MEFNQVIGQTFLAKYFQKTIQTERVPNTQLFVGNEGSGTLPMAWAFARTLLCGENPKCQHKTDKIIHPDLHFVFPTVTGTSGQQVESDVFLSQWREFIIANPYAGYYDWLQFINAGNKQGSIRVKDAETIIKKVAVKPYEAKYKVFIIWMAEKMNTETNNKLLKVLEEPPEDTKFILIAEKIENILPTVLSRCQIHHFKPVSITAIKEKLLEKGIEEKTALKIANSSEGNWNKALQLLNNNPTEIEFQELFVTWVRSAFLAKTKKTAIQKLIQWSEEVAGKGREEQKHFLKFITESLRQAMLINFGNESLHYMEFQAGNFDLRKLAPYVNETNIEEIFKLLNESLINIERNANPKLIFINLSLSLTKLIHRKKII